MTLLRHELFTEEFKEKYKEIERLLEEAYKHQKDHAGPEGIYWKSAEGYIQINMPHYFWISDADCRPHIMIYSYALGPSRSHQFRNIDDALTTVKRWHEAEMNFSSELYESDEDV